jgi:hypothetical protein
VLLAAAMVEQLAKYCLLLALATAPLSGCAYMTSSGRSQMAYQRYVRKQSGKRMKMQKKLKPPHMPLTPGPSEPKVETQVTEQQSPQSVTSGESLNNQ